MSTFLPTKDTLQGLLEFVAMSPEMANYLHDKLKKIFIAEDVDKKFGGLLVEMKNFSANVAEEQPKSDAAWTGKEDLRAQIAAQTAVAEPTVELEAEEKLSCVIEVTEQSQWTHFYTDNSTQLVHAQLDGWLQDWITKNGMVSRNHIMYTASEPPKVVPRSELMSRFKDPEQGFVEYVREHSAGKYRLTADLRALEAVVLEQPADNSPSSGSSQV